MLTFCLFVNIAFTWCYTIEPIKVPDREYIGVYYTTRYYAPMPWQDAYYSWSYDADYKMNCGGDCLITANGHKLKNWDEYKVFACPKDLDIWTRLFIEGIWEGQCLDRWWSIKNKRLDVWVGIGDNGVLNLKSRRWYDILRKVFILHK